MDNKGGNFLEDRAKSIDAINTLVQWLVDKDNVSFSNVIELLREKRREEKTLTVPLSALKNRALGILEAVTKYLKEELNLTYHQIAVLLNRDDRPIWVTYNKAKGKFPQELFVDRASLKIPVSIFTNRKLGVLENLVRYLKENLGLKYSDIAKMIDRDNRTIWASYNRIKSKIKNE
ncbi:MAG: hypothetical protein U9O94_11000 [Nanoarchaeota archaeon]|nr:hypothetical protein [Nanoarchaeota archaeon]